METLYDMLGARPDDDAESLKNAYRKAVMANHPDRHDGDPEAVARFTRIVTAYDVLRDSTRRAAYDRLLERQRRPPPLRSKARRATFHLAYQFAFNAIAGIVVGMVLVVGGYLLFVQGTTGGDADGTTAGQPHWTIDVESTKRAEPAKEGAPDHGPAHALPTPVTQGAAASAMQGNGAWEATQGPDPAGQTTGRFTPAVGPSGPKAAADDPGRGHGSEPPEQPQSAEPKTAAISQDEICKHDAAQLAHLRVSQGRDEVIRFERELGCEKLRPQVIRLRESVDPQ